MSFNYDLFVIDASFGGIAAAKLAATYGARVTISERDQVGGTCVVHGCIPSETDGFCCQFFSCF